MYIAALSLMSLLEMSSLLTELLVSNTLNKAIAPSAPILLLDSVCNEAFEN